MTLPMERTLLTAASPSVASLRQRLIESLRLRVLNVPRLPATAATHSGIAVLFSGGLDCTILARMAHDLVPHSQGIDLINVAFENPRVASQLQTQSNGTVADFYESCPDRITGRKSFAELRQTCPQRAWRFIAASLPERPRFPGLWPC